MKLHRYGDHPSQFCELSLPRGPGPFPVAVLIHGGFWRAQYDRKIEWLLFRSLRRRGFAVWNMEYRRLGAGGGWPMTFEDAAAGFDALAEKSDRLDLDRVVTIGHSAGGHLATWIAARHKLPAGAPGAGPLLRPVAAVAQAGCVDLRAVAALAQRGRSAVHELLEGRPEQVPERYALASPYELLPLGVPTLLVHGEADSTVLPSISRDYAARAGDEVELVMVPGEAHRAHLWPWSKCWRAVLGWLQRHPAA